MLRYLIKNCTIVNEGKKTMGDLLIEGQHIERIDPNISPKGRFVEINGEGKHLLPGVIDDQVHFREPGLTHKATIHTESRAAVAGGVTSFMEMPNTQPPVFTQELLEDKYTIAAQTSLANYSFYMGTSNDNTEAVLRTNEKKKDVCGIKIFMGSSTGGLLVDNHVTLNNIFRSSELLIATHCEEERVIKANYDRLKGEKKELLPEDHPLVRDTEACFASSLTAVQIAKKYDTRLHVLHITTAKELQLFSNLLPLGEKRITAEVCVHHLHYTSEAYAGKGHLIRCNPAIKSPENKEALWEALLDDRLDVIATDHAPHTLAEKGWYRGKAGNLNPYRPEEAGYLPYEKAHAGLPLIQHPLHLMLYYWKQGRITLEKIVEKMSHAVATCYQIEKRGFIREGYYADLVLADLEQPMQVSAQNIYYKCGWSPLEGMELPATISHTFVSGHPVYQEGKWDESNKGARLRFER